MNTLADLHGRAPALSLSSLPLGPALSVVAAPPMLPDLCELRFSLTEPVAAAVRRWAETHLGPDPLTPLAGGAAVPVQTLYFDTPALDVYGRSPGYRKNRFRARRVGEDPLVTLARRRKARLGPAEQSVAVPEWDLPRLGRETADPDWAGEWFRLGLARRGLRPICRVGYRRLTRIGQADGAPVRLCLDDDLRFAPAEGYRLGETAWLPSEGCVLELRFRHALPRLF
jgi:hypothetical protein